MFCPKARLGERLRHRRAARRQRQAMREATAAGWKSAHNMDHEDEDDNSSDEDLENEHNLWTTPEEEMLKQYFPHPPPEEDLKTPTRSTTTSHMKSQATIAAAFAGRLKLFTPEYFEISADGTPRVCTSPESTAEMLEEEDDENSESSSSSSSSNDSSIVRLSEHAPESPRAPESALSAQVTAMLEQLQYDNHHTIINNNDSNDVTETTEEPTITDTTTDDGGGEETAYHLQEVEAPSSSSSRVLFPAAYSAAATATSRYDDDSHGSNKNSDNHTSDDEDSVDYGGAETSMWQGVGTSFCSVASVTAATTKTTTTTTSSPPPPPLPDTTRKKAATSSLVTSTDLLVENTILMPDKDDEEEDVQHQGAQVFLYTESKTKYNLSIGPSEMSGTTTTTVTNQLLDLHEVVVPPPPRNITETEKIVQESSAEYQRYYRDEMDFLPRFADEDEEDHHHHHETSSVWEDLSYTPNGTYKSPSTTTMTNIQNPLRLSEILSPDNDNNKGTTTTTTPMVKQPQRDNLMSPLSAMVHPINLELFQNNDDDDDDPAKDESHDGDHEGDNCRFDESFTSSIATEPCDLSVSSCPVRRRGREEFVLSSSSDLIQQRRSDRSVSTSRTSSSFRSSLSRGRVRYSLSTGKRSMTKAQRQYSKDFLPKSLFLLPEKEIGAAVVSNTKTTQKQSHTTATDDDNPNCNKSDHRRRRMNSTLSVLLVHIQQHIFEVIAVDCYYKDDCTVGDVLSKARSSATDPALSEQRYISLVYDQQEFAAPMLKIHAAVDFTSTTTVTTHHHHQEYGDVDRRRLAIAVPEGSNGAQVQYIKKILWKNPKMKRWWNVEDPFQPPKMEVIREIHVPSPKHNNNHAHDSEMKQKQ